MNAKDYKAQVEQLQAEIAALKQQGVKRLSLKVSAKGGVSVYGLGRFPVTLYETQWDRLLSIAPEIREFLIANKSDLADPKDKAKVATAPTVTMRADTRKAKALAEMDDEDRALFASMTSDESRELLALVREGKE